MPRLLKREKVPLWRRRIERSREKRDTVIRDVVEKNLAATFSENGLKPHWWDEEDIWVNVPMIFATIRAEIPNLLYQNPQYSVNPRRPVMATEVDPQTGEPVQRDLSWERAQGSEEWLNHWFKASDGKQQTRLAILWAFLWYGVVKVGYTPSFEQDKRMGVVDVDDDGNLTVGADGLPVLESGDWLRDQDGKVVFSNGMPVPAPAPSGREEFFLESIDPRMMLHDPEGGEDIERHRWVAEEWVKPVWEVQDDERFPQHLRSKIKASETVETAGDRSGKKLLTWGATHDEQIEQGDEGMVRGYDIYDRVERRYYVLTHDPIPNTDDVFLLDEPVRDGIHKCNPYVFLKYNERVGDWYPITEVETMRPSAEEYSMLRSQMAIHGESAKPRIIEGMNAFYTEDADEEREKFSHGKAYAMIKANPEKLQNYQPPQLDQSFYAREGIVRGTFDQIAGASAAQRGAAVADTATEASIIAQGSETRANDRRDNLIQKFLADIGYKLASSGRVHASDTIYVRSSRRGHADQFLAIEPLALQIEADVDIVVGSTMAKNDPRVVGQIIQVVQAVGQTPHILLVEPLVERLLDGMNLDPHLAGELKKLGEQMIAAQQQQEQGAGADQNQQELGGDLPTGIANAMGGAPTGAMLN